MPVAGVFVNTEIGYDDKVITVVIFEILHGELHHPVGVPRLRPLRVFVLGNTEQDHARHTEVDKLAHLLAQRFSTVLHLPRQRPDRLGMIDAFPNKQRSDEVIRSEPGFADHPP